MPRVPVDYPRYKLGRLPSDPNEIPEKFSSYIQDASALPALPAKFGHEALLPLNLAMLGNDQVGDCTVAGADHAVMSWGADQKKEIVFSTGSALSDYSSITGYNPDDPNSDTGADILTVAKYWKNTGMIDASGKRHKIDTYLSINFKDIEEIKMATYLFGAIGLGIECPASAQTQFSQGKPWTPVRGAGSQIEGGHFIPLLGFDGTYFIIATWGRLQKMSASFFKRYVDEAVAYISLEDLNASGKTLEGFDLAQLESDIHVIGS